MNAAVKLKDTDTPNIYTLDKRVSLLEQSMDNIEKQLTKISDSVESILQIRDQETGAKKTRERFINGVITFAMLFAAFELHHILFK